MRVFVSKRVRGIAQCGARRAHSYSRYHFSVGVRYKENNKSSGKGQKMIEVPCTGYVFSKGLGKDETRLQTMDATNDSQSKYRGG